MKRLDTRFGQSPPPEEAYEELKLPRLLIFVGAASMVIAFLTLVANFVGLLLAMNASSTAARGPAFVPRGTPATRPVLLNPTTTPDSQVPSLGLTLSNRKFIVGKLSAMQKLKPTQTLELQYFLLLTGRSMFPSTTGTITDDDIKLQITGSGQHESTGPDDDAYTWFDTQNGKLKVFDSRVYLDRGGSNPRIATSYSINPATSPGPAYGSVGTARIDAIVRQIKTTWPTPPPLNAAQENTLIQELKSPTQPLLPPAPNQYHVSTVTVGSDGVTTIVFQSTGQISINPQGTTILKRSAPYIPPTYQPPAVAGLSEWATTLTLVDSLLSALLAFLLLVAGIQTLRGSRSGSLLHRIYAYIKLPLTILGAIAAVALSQKVSQDSAVNATPFDTPFSLVTPSIILLVALLSAAYPILLLIVFRMPKVRGFYRSVI